MKTSKMMGLAFLFSAFSVGVISAQEQKPAKDLQAIEATHADQMKKALNLTDDQAAKMKDIRLLMKEDRQQMMNSIREARKNYLAKLQEHNKEVQKILSSEQFQKYKERMHRMKDRMDGYRMGMRDVRRMDQRPMHHNMHKQGYDKHAQKDGQNEPASTPDNALQSQK